MGRKIPSSASSPSRLPAGAHLDEARAERVIRFFERCLVHVEGRFAGKPFLLEDWQKAIIRDLFGSVDRNGRRWYSEALLGIPRKNGKSTLTAGLGLYALMADDEYGAQVYSVAGSRKQAKIVFGTASKMAKASPVLAPHVRVFRNVIEYPRKAGVYEVLSADAGLAHGYNPSFVSVDELHIHKNGDLYEAMRTGMSDARREPMLVSITTAGHSYDSICRQLYEKGKQGENPRLYFRWFEAPEGADIDDVKAWRAANPSEFVSIEGLRDKRRALPENSFRRLHLNQWTRTENRVVDISRWDACAGRPEIPEGSSVIVTVDIAPRGKDSTAIGLIGAENAEGKHPARVRFFEADPDLAMVDYDVIENVIRDYAQRFDVREVAYDPYYFDRSALRLEAEGLPMVAFVQDDARMVPASQALFDAIVEGRLIHDGDRELRQHVENAGSKEGTRGWRFHKAKSSGRIDGVIVLAMGLHRWMHQEPTLEPVFYGLGGE